MLGSNKLKANISCVMSIVFFTILFAVPIFFAQTKLQKPLNTIISIILFLVYDYIFMTLLDKRKERLYKKQLL